MKTNKRYLRELFGDDFVLFNHYYGGDNSRAIRYGYDTLADLWAANPEVVMPDKRRQR